MEPQDDTPIEIKPVGNTDERMFLYYAYGKLRSCLPASFVDSDQMQEQLGQLRYRTNRYHEYVKDRKIDDSLELLYADLLVAIDADADYLIQFGRIERGAVERAEQAARETGLDAGFAGGSAAASARNNGATGGNAALNGLAAAGITWLMDEAQKKQELDEDKRQAIESASEELKRKMSIIDARADNTIDDLATRYHWEKQADGKPIDTFKNLEDNLTNQYLKASTSEEALAATKRMLDVAALIPAGGVYDEHRAYALYWAARSETWASEQQLKGRKWGDAKAPSADYAVRLWDAALRCAGEGPEVLSSLAVISASKILGQRYAVKDPNSAIRAQRAWALAVAGRFNEAMTQANAVVELQQNDPDFAYNYACLLSCTKDPQNCAMGWLRAALLHNGEWFNNVRVQKAKTDPNLEDLRGLKSDAFADLVKVKWGWEIKGGLINHSIVLTNNSAFPITNVVLAARIESGVECGRRR